MDNASTAAVSSVIMTDVMIYVVGSLLIITHSRRLVISGDQPIRN